MYYSFGIALIQKNGPLYEILLTQKRNTYAFIDFINARYKSEEDLLTLFSKMTNDECFLILSLDFDKIYYRYTLISDSYSEAYALYKENRYAMLKKIFEKNARRYKFKNLMARAMPDVANEELWEIPRGRRALPDELPINCAQREFEEETEISPEKYTQTMESFTIIQDEIYEITYFFAISEAIIPRLNILNYLQISEVKDIRFVPLKDLYFYNIYAKDVIRYNVKKFIKAHF